jgi:hypothetical protein
MSRAADCGAVILPPMPAFYHRPESIMDLIHQSISKELDQFGIEHNLFQRWNGNGPEVAAAPSEELPERSLRALGWWPRSGFVPLFAAHWRLDLLGKSSGPQDQAHAARIVDACRSSAAFAVSLLSPTAG